MVNNSDGSNIIDRTLNEFEHYFSEHLTTPIVNHITDIKHVIA